MAILSATTILRSLSLLHLTTAYYLLTAPSKIADQNLVFILGAAMDLVTSHSPPFQIQPSSYELPSSLIVITQLTLFALFLTSLKPHSPFQHHLQP